MVGIRVAGEIIRSHEDREIAMIMDPGGHKAVIEVDSDRDLALSQ
jgi:hypothetical protein